MLNGILCINKPTDFTSFDVVAKMRGITKCKKIGHGGTLDPLATGVLPLFFGNATKAVDMLPNSNKRYTASFKLGIATDTQDITGKIIEQHESAITIDEINFALNNFRGEIVQIPPMYSAIKIDGQKLYDLARKGKVVERQGRNITIYELNLLEFDEKTQIGIIDVLCSKGTYIRTLCNDLGNLLGVGATLTKLERTRSGEFSLDNCITIEQAKEMMDNGNLQDNLLDVQKAFLSLHKINLNEAQSRMFLNGVKLDLQRLNFDKSENLYTVYNTTNKNDFLGIAKPDFDKNELRIEKIFAV